MITFFKDIFLIYTLFLKDLFIYIQLLLAGLNICDSFFERLIYMTALCIRVFIEIVYNFFHSSLILLGAIF